MSGLSCRALLCQNIPFFSVKLNIAIVVRSRGVATGGAWGSRAPPATPNTLFGTPRFCRILTLALWCQPSQASHWLPHTPHFPSLAPALKYWWRRPWSEGAGSVTQSGTGSVTLFMIPCITYKQPLQIITEPTGNQGSPRSLLQ